MLQIIIIVFREILEISLIIGILTAVTKAISGRIKLIYSGLFFGLLGSLSLAFFIDKISDSFGGIGQEIYGGVILFLAATLISCTTIWMQKHAKNFSGDFKALSSSVANGQKSPIILMIIVILSVLREGSEIVLFSYGSYLSGVDLNKIVCGILIGLFLGASFGISLYFGALKFLGKYFLTLTSVILIFLASSTLSKAFAIWAEADLLPSFGNPIWDSSFLLSQQSLVGKFCNIFFGYVERPLGIEMAAYFFNIILVSCIIYLIKKSDKKLGWYDVKTKSKQMLRSIFYNSVMQEIISILIAGYMCFVYISSRKKIIIGNDIIKHIANKKPLIAASWHNRLMMTPFFSYLINKEIKSKYNFFSLTSKHGDGRFVARVLHKFGFKNIYGSSKKGRVSGRGISVSSMREVIRGLKNRNGIAITPDGPRGPNQKINGEIIKIAKISNAMIAAASYSSSRFFVFNSWDKFKLPLPFSRLCFYCKDFIYVDKNLTEKEELLLKNELEEKLNQAQNQSLFLVKNWK